MHYINTLKIGQELGTVSISHLFKWKGFPVINPISQHFNNKQVRTSHNFKSKSSQVLAVSLCFIYLYYKKIVLRDTVLSEGFTKFR